MLLLTASSLPGADIDRFVDEFGWLSDLAGPVRAADVLALEVEGRGSLDVGGIAELDLIAEQLRRQRRAPMRALRGGLASSRVVEFGSRWRDALERLARGEVTGTSTTSAFARVQLEAAFRRVVQVAKLVDADVPAAGLHELRKRIRTLRVVLDTFETTFDDASATPLATAATRLHHRLGIVQDSSAAAAGLTEAARRLAARSAPVDAVLSIGALRERANLREAAARAGLAKPLRQLVGRKLARQVDALTRTT